MAFITESETAIYNLVVSNKLRNNLHAKASLLIQALFIDFRDVSLRPLPLLDLMFGQKRAVAKKALLSKKQNFDTGVRATRMHLLMFFHAFCFQEKTASRGCKPFFVFALEFIWLLFISQQSFLRQ
jgi:hypothetical protein